MSTPKHGTYEAGLGFYDSSLRGWIKDRARLTEVVTGPPTDDAQREAVAAWGKKAFKPAKEFEALIKMRESEKPERRAQYEQMVAGRERIRLFDYEAKRAAAIKAGQWWPGA